MPRKTPKDSNPKLLTQSRFLSASAEEWKTVHSYKQTDYLREITSQIIWKYLPVNDLSHLALEALTAIISEQVFTQLLLYLRQQTNILKILVIVLSDDYTSLLSKVELPPESNQDSDDEKLDNGKVVFGLGNEVGLNLAQIESPDTCIENVMPIEIYPNAEDNNSSQTMTKLEEVDSDEDLHSSKSPDSGAEFVSEDLMHYFRVAPTSFEDGHCNNTSDKKLSPSEDEIVSSGNPNDKSSMIISRRKTMSAKIMSASNQQLKHNTQSQGTPPNTIPAMSMMPAMQIASNKPDPEIEHCQSMPVAVGGELKSHTPSIDQKTVRRRAMDREASVDSQSSDSGFSIAGKDELG